jgi:hypothetical protein
MIVLSAGLPAGTAAARRMLAVTLVPLCLASWPAGSVEFRADRPGILVTIPASSIEDALESPLDIPGHVPRRDRVRELEQRERMKQERMKERRDEYDRRVLEERRDFREQRRRIEEQARERLERERLRRRDEMEQRDPRQGG